MKVRDLMTTNVVTVGADDRLIAAEELMGLRGFRHMPVVEAGDRLVGILSQVDIVRATLQGDEGDRRQQLVKKAQIVVRDIMASRIDSIGPDANLREAAQRMRKTRHSALPVIDDQGVLLGIVTEADFVMMVRDLLGDEQWAGELKGRLDAARA